MRSAGNLLVRNNVLEVSAASPIQDEDCASVRSFNNRTPDGLLLARVDLATGEYQGEQFFDVFAGPAEDSLVSANFDRS